AADERPVCHSERSEESTLSPAFPTWILRSAQNDKRWFDVIAMIDLGKFIARYTQSAPANYCRSQNDKIPSSGD
ncbi:MAG: hypothetical protein ABIO94_05530, partial [Opitutaceae bacterium]